MNVGQRLHVQCGPIGRVFPTILDDEVLKLRLEIVGVIARGQSQVSVVIVTSPALQCVRSHEHRNDINRRNNLKRHMRVVWQVLKDAGDRKVRLTHDVNRLPDRVLATEVALRRALRQHNICRCG